MIDDTVVVTESIQSIIKDLWREAAGPGTR
jgi:hypothetical protein